MAATSTSRKLIDMIRVNHVRVLRNVAKVARTPSITQIENAGGNGDIATLAPTYWSRCENSTTAVTMIRMFQVLVFGCRRSGSRPMSRRKLTCPLARCMTSA